MKTRHSTTTFRPDAIRVAPAVRCGAGGGFEDVEAFAKRCVR